MENLSTLFYRRKLISRGYEFVPGEVIGFHDDTVQVRFDETVAETESEIELYYPDGEGFLLQQCRIDRVRQSDSGYYLNLTMIGEAAESGFRRSERVDTTDQGILADMAGETDLEVLDVSDTGLSVAARKLHVIGSTCDVTMHFNRLHLEGTVSIRSVSPPDDAGWFHYGLRCEQVSENSSLMRMLPKIVVALMVKELAGCSADADDDDANDDAD